MISAIWQIARLQLLENIRRQVHLITLFMAFLMLILPAYVNAFSMGLKAFEIASKDFGLTLLGYYGVGMALTLGSSVVPRDIERKTRSASDFTRRSGWFRGIRFSRLT